MFGHHRSNYHFSAPSEYSSVIEAAVPQIIWTLLRPCFCLHSIKSKLIKRVSGVHYVINLWSFRYIGLPSQKCDSIQYKLIPFLLYLRRDKNVIFRSRLSVSRNMYACNESTFKYFLPFIRFSKSL